MGFNAQPNLSNGFTAPRNRSVNPVRDSMLMVETCGKLQQKKVFSNEVNTTDSVPPKWRLAEFIPHNTMYLCGAHRHFAKPAVRRNDQSGEKSR